MGTQEIWISFSFLTTLFPLHIFQGPSASEETYNKKMSWLKLNYNP